MSDDKKVIYSIEDVCGTRFDFYSVKEILEFFEKEAQFWADTRTLFPGTYHNFVNQADQFRQRADQIKDLVESGHKEEKVVAELNRVTSPDAYKNGWLSSQAGITEEFIEVHKRYTNEGAESFWHAATNPNSHNIRPDTNHRFGGAFAGTIYKLGDSFVERKDSEVSALEAIRTDAQESISNLKAEISDLQDRSAQLFSDQEQDWEARKTEMSDRHDRLVHKHTTSHEEQFESFETKMSQIESAYKEKMMLSEPAKYWAKSARWNMWQGVFWSAVVSGITVYSVSKLAEFFNTWLAGERLPIDTSSLQGAILFAVILAFLMFLLRATTRLAFSSFHLMRDSQEREKLTSFYLALIKEGAVDSEHKALIIQSLFSRSDSGLLNTETGPTMPSPRDLRAVVGSS